MNTSGPENTKSVHKIELFIKSNPHLFHKRFAPSQKIPGYATAYSGALKMCRFWEGCMEKNFRNRMTCSVHPVFQNQISCTFHIFKTKLPVHAIFSKENYLYTPYCIFIENVLCFLKTKMFKPVRPIFYFYANQRAKHIFLSRNVSRNDNFLTTKSLAHVRYLYMYATIFLFFYGFGCF